MPYVLDMRHFAGRLVAEKELNGMFAGDIGTSDPRRQPDSLTRFHCGVTAQRQMIDITAA